MSEERMTKADGTAGTREEVGAASAGDATHAQGDAHGIAGDRGIPSVNRARSLQARVSNLLAMGLMSALGLGFLAWYYTGVFARRSEREEQAQTTAKVKAQGEMVLPALGRIDPPQVAPTTLERVLGPPPPVPFESSALWPEDAAMEREPGTRTTSYGVRTATPAERTHARRLAGPAFMSAQALSRTQGGSPRESDPADGFSQPGAGTASIERMPRLSSASGGDIESLLQPTVTPAAHAQVLPTQRLLLPKGAFLDCTLETAIDSTLPGMTTCITATDTFSVDGSVVLLERGTKLIGETRGQVRQGASRVFVLWAQARTPAGVVVTLASPGTDALGRSGLPGEVDRHFLERFGAAILISVIDAAVQSAVQSGRDGATVIYNPSSSQDIMTEVLRSTVNIPPTVRIAQGERIQILVARDLDFRSVYRLDATGE